MKQGKNSWKRFKAPIWLPIALMGTALMSALFYPGHLNGDSHWQMDQATVNQYNSHHPVIMAYVWHFLMYVVSGQGGLFLFHVILFWLGIAWLIEERVPNAAHRGFYALAYLAYVPLSITFFTIVKDTGLAAAMVLATGALIRYDRTREGWVIVVAIASLWYASFVRHGGYLATGPYFVWAGILLSRKRWKEAALGIALIVLIPWPLYEHLVLHPVNGRESQIPMLYDIVAMSVERNESFVPDFYSRGKPPIQTYELRALYDPCSSISLFWPRPGIRRDVGWVYTDREWITLFATWVAVIASDPMRYAHYRLRLGERLLGFNVPNYWPYWLPSSEEFMPMSRWNKPIQLWLTNQIQDHRYWFIFKSWFYYLLIFVLAGSALSRNRRQNMAFLCILASVLFYEASVFLLAVDSDFRFSSWAMFGALILPLVADFHRSGKTFISPFRQRRD